MSRKKNTKITQKKNKWVFRAQKKSVLKCRKNECKVEKWLKTLKKEGFGGENYVYIKWVFPFGHNIELRTIFQTGIMDLAALVGVTTH